MANCEFIKSCIFFNDKMQNMPATANILKSKFCQEDFSDCARYKVSMALGRSRVPNDLYPHQGEKAVKIIEQAEA